MAQEFTNRALLTKVANRSKAAMDASVYLTEVKKEFPRALELQCIPESPELWSLAHYVEFLEARRRVLASHINVFLKTITDTVGAPSVATIEDVIAEGESDELEFKATLRWDLEAGAVNRKLEEAIIKAVAAFGNAHGGSVLIGVDDEGQTLGLQHDYKSLGDDADRDKFERHLRGVLYQSLGKSFVTTKVKVRFHDLEGADVCQVDVAMAKEPIVVASKDRNGVVVERLYVRSGNASQEIPLSEVSAYLKERFK